MTDTKSVRFEDKTGGLVIYVTPEELRQLAVRECSARGDPGLAAKRVRSVLYSAPRSQTEDRRLGMQCILAGAGMVMMWLLVILGIIKAAEFVAQWAL